MRSGGLAPGRPVSLLTWRRPAARAYRRAPGIEHYDMYFPDGHNPPDEILERFLDVARKTDGANALAPAAAVVLGPAR